MSELHYAAMRPFRQGLATVGSVEGLFQRRTTAFPQPDGKRATSVFHTEKEIQKTATKRITLRPDLLPDKNGVRHQMDGRWDESVPCKKMEFEYPFLHPGLMRSLICDAGRRAGEHGVYWKYGVWVFEPQTGCRAMIEQEMQGAMQGKIIVKIQGDCCADLAKWLREKIKERSRLFGYPDVKPTQDDFKPCAEAHLPERRAKIEVLESNIKTPPPEPKLGQMPPEKFQDSDQPEVFISYAWGDETPEGKRRKGTGG